MSKFIKISWYLFVGLGAAVTLEYARQGFIEDLSLQPPYQREKNKQANERGTSRFPVYLISYADGNECHLRNQHAMVHSALNKGIDFILNYRKDLLDRELKDLLDKEILGKQGALSQEIGGGFWIWKPHIILKTMKMAPEGALILYLDAAFKINQPIDDFLHLLGEDDILLIQDRHRENGSYVKGDAFYLMDCTSEKCRKGPHIWSAIILIRNTPRSRAFMEKWHKASLDPRLMTEQSWGFQENYPEYQWYHYDQSLLSLVYLKNPAGVKCLPYKETEKTFSWVHRKASRSSPLKPWYTVYGTDCFLGRRESGKSLTSYALLNLPPVVFLRKLYYEMTNSFSSERKSELS